MYSYCFNNKDAYCTIQKDYRLCLQKTGQKIHIVKEKKARVKDVFFWDRTKLNSGHITAESVSSQLANVGNIGFEVTDACNLKCYYCAYRDFYNDYDLRKNQYMDGTTSRCV